MPSVRASFSSVVVQSQGKCVGTPVHRGNAVGLEVVVERRGSAFVEPDQEDPGEAVGHPSLQRSSCQRAR